MTHYEDLDKLEKAEYVRQRIIDYLRDKPDARTPELVAMMGVAKASTHKVLRGMLNRGEVSRRAESKMGGGIVYVWNAEADTISAVEVKQILTRNLQGRTPVLRLFGGL